jgi:hypothetical protein
MNQQKKPRPPKRILRAKTPGLLDRAMMEVEYEDAVIDFLTNPGPCSLWMIGGKPGAPESNTNASKTKAHVVSLCF